LEYNNSGLIDQAIYEFELLPKKFPDYLPVYYQAAHLYMETGDLEKAERTFKNGIP
jgi:tetratricopeptide (TPR) repeat protein